MVSSTRRPRKSWSAIKALTRSLVLNDGEKAQLVDVYVFKNVMDLKNGHIVNYIVMASVIRM